MELQELFHNNEELHFCKGQLTLVDVRKFMCNHKGKLRIAWSTLLLGHLDRLHEQDKSFKFVININKTDKTSTDFKAVFYYHEKYQQTIAKGYNHKIHFDSTFNCTWENLSLLNVVVMDSNNHYFVVGSVLYHNNHKKESDFIWMMEAIRVNLFGYKKSTQ